MGLGHGDPLLVPGLHQAEGRPGHAEHQRHEDQPRRRHLRPVPPDELPQAIRGRRRAGRDRLVGEEPLDVVAQADRRVVPPLPLLGQRLHHDPVGVAADQPRQPRRLDVPGRGDAQQRSGRLDTGRRRRRFVVANQPQHLVQGRPLQRLPRDRRRAGQQLVEDHAQGVDVGPGVDVQRVEGRLLRRHVQRRAGDAAKGGEQALLGQPHPAGGLGQAEVDHLGHRAVVVRLDQDVGGLQVAVDDPLLVRVLHGPTDLLEQRQPGGDVEAMGVAVVGDGDALDQLHHEERAAVGGRAGVEDAGDVGVLHQGQGLALRLEAGQDVARVHPPLDQLERHLAADRAELLGEEDGAHAALADLLAELVAIGDDRADEFRAVVPRPGDGGVVEWRFPRRRQGRRCGRPGRIGDRRSRGRGHPLGSGLGPRARDGSSRSPRRVEVRGGLQEAAGLVQGSEQRVDFLAEFGVPAAAALEVGGAFLGRGDLGGLVEDRFHAAPVANHDQGLHRRTAISQGYVGQPYHKGI